MIRIRLTDPELRIAELIGGLRQEEALARGCKDKHNFKGDPLQTHIDGVKGEMAVAHGLNLYFTATLNGFRRLGDLFYQTEVKWRSDERYDLLVRPDDVSDRKFVHCAQLKPHLIEVYGWVYGYEAKDDRWLANYGNRGPAYFVPREAQRPLSELHRIITQRHQDFLLSLERARKLQPA